MNRTHSNAIVAHVHMSWPSKEDFVSSLMLHTEVLDKKDAKTALRPPQDPAAGAAARGWHPRPYDPLGGHEA